jgi:fatty-acyl-CoA synthase
MTARPTGKTLARIVEEKAALSPNHPAIIYGEETVSYADLVSRSNDAARALLAIGVRRGDRVGVLIGNEPEWVVMALAASIIGATCVPLNTWHKRAEIAWVIGHCGLVAVIAVRQFLKTDYGALFHQLIPELAEAFPGAIQSPAFPMLRSIVLIGERVGGTFSFQDFLRCGRALPDSTLRAARAGVDPEATAFILYTSGSTAEPKGVELRHRGVVENGFDLGQRRAITDQDRTWLGTPLFYALGATNALPATFTAGATLVLQGSFEAGAAIDVVERTGATVYYGTGNMSRAILDHPEYRQARIGTLKKGNAGLGAEYKRLTLVEMGITGAVPAYGLTETYGNATAGEADDPIEVKMVTDGRPLGGQEVVIVDPDRFTPRTAGQTGLILVRGHTTSGYFGNPSETAKALRFDGFFDTGDLGSLDGDGRLIFHSRLKDVIKSGGINISPTEIEQLLASHPDVRDAHVVGVSDPVRGELIVAFVDPLVTLSDDALKAFVKEQAASFKVPHHIFFRSEAQLPRLATGKIAKTKLSIEARSELGLS